MSKSAYLKFKKGEQLSRKGINSKEQNGMWKGNNCTLQNGRMRASHWYKIKECEICGRKAIDRHHRDDNQLNNNPDNIQALCRRCHMQVDGRMTKFNQLERIGIHGSNGRFVSQSVQCP